jgi:hypothetical protein
VDAVPILDAVFGVEPKGVTARPTWQVLKACDIVRDRDALHGRIQRTMMDGK